MSLTDLFGHLQQTLGQLTYVGPLREYPKRYYQLSGEKFLHVGKRGERAVEIVCNEEILGREEIQCKLSHWLSLMNVAKKIRFSKIGGNLYALLLKTPVSGTEVNIADVGFGVSQVIPIIVETCIMKEKETLILEQPEIHVHPLGQMIMADLFVETANQERRFIIETHSEHLLLRVQRRIAEGKISANDVAVYYFEPKEKEIVIHELKMSKSGQFEDLPPGFIDERLEEAYKIAVARED
jgi:hypothetical protein